MLGSLYSAVNGLKTHQQKMDVVGNNISNVSTYGYKASRMTFRDSFYETLQAASRTGATVGGTNPRQLGHGAIAGSIDVLHSRSGFAPTGFALDAAIMGNGYFMVGQPVDTGIYSTPRPGEPNKIQGLNLTRVGTFGIDGEGNLVDSNGNYVYGYHISNKGASKGKVMNIQNYYTNTTDITEVAPNPDPGHNDALKMYRIRIPKEKVTVNGTQVYKNMDLSGISIGRDGVITGIKTSQPDVNGNVTNEIVYIGQIALASVTNPSALQMTQNTYFKAKENVGEIMANKPGEGSTGDLMSGGLEMSNVDLAQQFTEMITTQRGFQANTKMITVSDEMLAELVNMKR